jgi:hypothetical protein
VSSPKRFQAYPSNGRSDEPEPSSRLGPRPSMFSLEVGRLHT